MRASSKKKFEFDGEFYHIYNRGVLKQNIFLDNRDYARFLFLILSFQSSTVFKNIGRQVSAFVQSSTFNIEESDVTSNRGVELLAFALMPNHIHLLAKEVEESGLANYMHRVNTAYTKYFNTKYKRGGHLFQSRYRSVLVDNNDQLLYLSAYVHKNPKTLKGWSSRYHQYPWSSCGDFIRTNRWNNLLVTDPILGQFKNQDEYRDWIANTTAKELEQFGE